MNQLLTYLMNLIMIDRRNNSDIGGLLHNVRESRIKIHYKNKGYIITVVEE